MIVKHSYRDQVRNILLDRMKKGELSTGDSISLAELSRDLQVSVTPIREALTQLEHSNIIKSIPNRGFVVPIIQKDEAKNLYEMVACIEGFAIETTNITKRTIANLLAQQAVLEKASTAIERINADMTFHEILIGDYENPVAKQILSDLKTRIFFYELDFMKVHGFYGNSEKHHHQLIEHLKVNNSKSAIEVLRANWMQIINYSG